MKRQEIFILIVTGFILVVLWVIFNIYHSLITSTISEDQTVQILPIAGRFDIKTLESLKERKVVTPFFGSDGTTPIATPSGTVSLPTPTPSISITPIPSTITPTITPSVSQEQATSGGTLQ